MDKKRDSSKVYHDNKNETLSTQFSEISKKPKSSSATKNTFDYIQSLIKNQSDSDDD